MSDIRDAILAEFPRLRALWPALNGKPEHLSEIGRAVMAYAERITPADVAKGFDEAIRMSPTTGWAPGPHEVLGCVLAVADTRRRAEVAERKRATRDAEVPARHVVGRVHWCGQPLALLTDERALWCDTCRAVVVTGGSRGAPRYALDDQEFDQLATLAHAGAPDTEDVDEW